MKCKLINIFKLLSIIFLVQNVAYSTELLEKTFGKPSGSTELGKDGSKQGAKAISDQFLTRDDNINAQIEQRKNIYNQIKEQIKKYTKENENLPFAIGNNEEKVKVKDIFNSEENYIKDEEIKSCNKDLRGGSDNENAYSFDELVKEGKNTGSYPCVMSEWKHEGGLFRHRSVGAMGGCYEEHRVSDDGKNKGLKVVGEYVVTFGDKAVPIMYRPDACVPLKKPFCTTWTIKADKIEYYFPTEKITLSQEPLYTRFIEQNEVKKIFEKYKEAVKSELKNSTMTQKTLKNVTNKEVNSGKNKVEYNGELQPGEGKGDNDATFLGQIDRGYGRYFGLEGIEEGYSKAKGHEGTIVLPHISSEKEYFGTDYDANNISSEFTNNAKDKKNLAYFMSVGEKYSSKILKEKHTNHIKNPWEQLAYDTKGGGSITMYKRHYSGEGSKAFKEIVPKSKETSASSVEEANDYRKNKVSFGIGNISSLTSLTPKGNSDYILQTLVRTHNMFLEEKKPIQDEQSGDANLKINVPGAITTVGAYFTNTSFAGNKGKRPSFKTKWDIFHCPTPRDEDGKYKDDGKDYPKSFNSFFNKDVQNAKELTTGASNKTVISQDGDDCYKYENLLRNNLDFFMINTISSDYDNITTVANKGEISFTVYTLFSGAVGFPGQGMPFFESGIGSLFGTPLSSSYNEKDGSKAEPKIENWDFRLF